jgi:hypothetical protein
MKTVERIAAEPIPFGCPVRAEGEGCAVSVQLVDMIGIARRPPPGSPLLADGAHLYARGAPVTIVTDGGVRADLADNVEIAIAGVVRFLRAIEPHYFTVSEGKIVG